MSFLLGSQPLRQKATRRPIAKYLGYVALRSPCVFACVSWYWNQMISPALGLSFWFFLSTQVEFNYPAHVSPGAQDLINKLLKHNPLHRLPIHGVLAHPWVVENSTKKPAYLPLTSQPAQPAPTCWSQLWRSFADLAVCGVPNSTMLKTLVKAETGHESGRWHWSAVTEIWLKLFPWQLLEKLVKYWCLCSSVVLYFL